MTDPISSPQGYCAPGFEAVRDAFAENFTQGLELGASFAAVREGEILVNLWQGWADRAKTSPWLQHTLVPVFSVTKPIGALIVSRLVGQGLIDYEAPVTRYWPEWGAGKESVSVAQALSHQAGVCGFPEPIDPALWLEPRALAQALADLVPLWPPGSASGYHASTWGYIAGELVQRVAGRSLGTILREEVAKPLGIDFHIGLPDSEHGRVAELQRPVEMPALGAINPQKRATFLTRWSTPDRGGAEWRRVEIPSTNGHGTALSVARLYQAYAGGGCIDGVTITEPAAFEALTRLRIEGEDLVLPYFLSFAAGVMRNSRLVYGPNPGAFGHSGWGGSMAFGDPDRHLSAAYVMNRQTNNLQGDARAKRVIGALYRAI
jgi:CubicO group peptidase (beta-lactamase class C family)